MNILTCVLGQTLLFSLIHRAATMLQPAHMHYFCTGVYKRPGCRNWSGARTHAHPWTEHCGLHFSRFRPLLAGRGRQRLACTSLVSCHKGYTMSSILKAHYSILPRHLQKVWPQATRTRDHSPARAELMEMDCTSRRLFRRRLRSFSRRHRHRHRNCYRHQHRACR
jgi:hypothetical protein